MSNIDKLRYILTNHREEHFFTYRNFMLLTHPSIKNKNALDKLFDDIELMPEIEQAKDKIEIKFYKYDYNKKIYSKSELLSFILASINEDWNIIKGIDITTGKIHVWLNYNDIIFDPSLSIITNKETYKKQFKQIEIINNKDIFKYLEEHNNLYEFYNKGLFKKNKEKEFSINFIKNIIKEFNNNIEKQYELDETRIKNLKEHITYNNFRELRQVLTRQRKNYIESNNIAIHPSIDKNILKTIDDVAKNINEIMKKEYNMSIDYYNGTLGNCYALSILFNLSNEEFKLIQGAIPYKEQLLSGIVDRYYQHSWLEKDNIIYDPALRIITTKELYYTFVIKEDEYTKEDTENILRRIGFNLTHFRDFINGVQIGNNESIIYRTLNKKIDSKENKDAGEKLINSIKSLKLKKEVNYE